MIERFFNFFIDNYRLTLTLTAAIFILGVLGVIALNRETFPPVDFAQAQITTFYPGSSPEEVEETITKKIEDEIRPISGIKDVRSVSQAGLSEITVRVEIDSSNTKDVLDDVQRAVQRVTDLPDGVLERPTFLRLNSKEIPVLELAVMGSNESRARNLLADRLKRVFEDVPGVAQVRTTGYHEREFQILLDIKKLSQFHVGIEKVVNAVRKRTRDIPAGYIRTDALERLVRVSGQVKSAQEMGEIVIRSNFQGEQIRVKDIAQVMDAEEEPTTLVQVNGKEATLLTVSKKENSDATRTVDGLKSALEKFQAKAPSGFDFVVYNDEADRVGHRLEIVVNNAIVGLILVVVILLLFLPGIVGIMASLSLPIAVFATIAFMASFGINFNTITMLALVIAIGMLVDNSVVISENYARLRRGEGMDRLSAAQKAVSQFWLPITATVLTTVAAFLPMLVTKGIMGKFIKWIPIVVSISLIFSLVEGFILLPTRLRFTLRKDNVSESKSINWFDPFQEKFAKMIRVTVDNRYLTFAGFGLLILFSILLTKFGNRFELFPKEGVEIYSSRIEAPIESTITQTEKYSERVAKDLLEAMGPGIVSNQVLRVGISQTRLADERKRTGDNVAMILTYVPRDIARDQNVDEVLSRLQKVDKGPLVNLSTEALAPGPPVGNALSLTFRSNSFTQLQGISAELKDYLSTIEGVYNIADDEIKGGPEYALQLDHINIARLNLSTEAIGIALRTALQGAIASELNIDNTDFDLRIRYGQESRGTLEALQNTRILEPSGNLIPLSSLAKITEARGPSIRKHFDFSRSLTVTADVVPTVITSTALNALTAAKVKSLFEKYNDVSFRVGGEGESTTESVNSLFSAMILALFGILGILLFLFKSYMKSALVLSSIPLSLIGVNISFFLHQKPLGFFALIGVIGLAGVVVNSAIVLISFIEDMEREGKEPLHDILSKASALRLRAVMATSLTTVGGLIPTAYGFGGYDQILVPMTLALAWGLISGTILTLIWIPAGYAISMDIRNFFNTRILRPRERYNDPQNPLRSSPVH